MSKNFPVVLLDPGHGASDYFPKGSFKRPLMTLQAGLTKQVCGTARHPNDKFAGYYREDLGTLAISIAAQQVLVSLGYPTYLTRSADDDVNCSLFIQKALGNTSTWRKMTWQPYQWVKLFANEIKSMLFVSIHTNAGGGTGCASYYGTADGENLGSYILARLSNKLNLRIRKNSVSKYSVLFGHSQNRTCLLECAFHDHPSDLSILLSSKGIPTIGSCIADGIDSYAKFTGLLL